MGIARKSNCRLLITAFITLFQLSLVGCSTFTKKDDSELLPLLPFNDKQESQLLKQSVTVKKGDNALTFLAISRLNKVELKSVAVLPSGQQLYAFEFDGKRIKSEVSEFMKIDAREILAIQQFSLWPEDVIQHGYAAVSDWDVKVFHNSRELYYQQALGLSAIYSDEGVLIRHHLKGYEMFIRLLEKK